MKWAQEWEAIADVMRQYGGQTIFTPGKIASQTTLFWTLETMAHGHPIEYIEAMITDANKVLLEATQKIQFAAESIESYKAAIREAQHKIFK